MIRPITTARYKELVAKEEELEANKEFVKECMEFMEKCSILIKQFKARKIGTTKTIKNIASLLKLGIVPEKYRVYL